MCVLEIHAWQPCLHMRCTSTRICSKQIASPGTTEYDCPDATRVYLRQPPKRVCPVCKARSEGTSERGEGASDEGSEQPSEGGSEPTSKAAPRATTTDPSQSATPLLGNALAVDATALFQEHTDEQRDLHEARHRGRGVSDEPSLAALSNEEVRELLRKELWEDGV